MTALAEAPGRDDLAVEPRPPSPPTVDPARPAVEPLATGGIRRLVVAWLVITAVGIALVMVNVGPASEEREQRSMLASYRQEIESASNQAFGLAGVETPTEAPSRGEPVAILDIEAIDLGRVVVEGTDPPQTRTGPGHVVGTGGPGQPGNSVIVGRRGLGGAAFAGLTDVEVGDRILVTTTQGQTVYEVAHVGRHEIVDEPVDDPVDDGGEPTTSTTVPVVAAEAGDDDAPTDQAATGDGEAAGDDPVLPDGPVTVEQVYGPSPDDRLTLVTSASTLPWATDEALVVVALMDGTPFSPTPQGGRTAGDDGRGGDPGVAAPLLLALLAYATAVVATVWLHRHLPWRSAYLISAPLLIALTIVVAEQLTNVLPAWA